MTAPAQWAQVTPAPAAGVTGLEAAPRDLRVLAQLAAAGHGVAWRVWRIGPEGAPDGWTLNVTPPGGPLQRYTWVRSGGRMPLAAQSETALTPRGERPRGR